MGKLFFFLSSSFFRQLGKKNRSSLGTRRFGCKASVQVRLLNVSNGMQVLEIQVPMMSAHLPAHKSIFGHGPAYYEASSRDRGESCVVCSRVLSQSKGP